MKKKTKRKSEVTAVNRKRALWITAALGLIGLICAVAIIADNYAKKLFELISNGDLELDDGELTSQGQ